MLESHLSKFLTNYKTISMGIEKGFVELEIGILGIDKELFLNIIERLSNDESFTDKQTSFMIDFMYDTLNGEPVDKEVLRKFIKSKHFNSKGELTQTEIYEKRRVGNPIMDDSVLPYRLKISKEMPINDFVSVASPIVRFKVRVSFTFGRWRVDMTATKTSSFNTVKNNLKDIKMRLFKGRTIENMKDIKDLEKMDYEMEIEYIGKPKDITIDDFSVVSDVWSRIDPKYMEKLKFQNTIHSIASKIFNKDRADLYKRPEYGIKQLANAVIMITKNFYYKNMFPPEGYYVAPKVDGVHIMGFVEKGKCDMVGKTHYEFNISLGSDNNNTNNTTNTTIFDGEYLEDLNTIIIFDVLYYNGTALYNKAFRERVKYLKDVVLQLKNDDERFKKITPQEYTQIAGNAKQVFKTTYEKKRPYEIDGLILTTPDLDYTNTKNYKFKEASHNTIDFWAVKLIDKYVNVYPYVAKKGYDIYLLFTGISIQMFNRVGKTQLPFYKELMKSAEEGEDRVNYRDYFPTHFATSANDLSYIYYHPKDNDINGKIVELFLKDGEWAFNRVRDDRIKTSKYFGNDFRIAELTYANYIDPFTLKDLWERSPDYVMCEYPTEYRQMLISRENIFKTCIKNYMAKVKTIIAISNAVNYEYMAMLGAKNLVVLDTSPNKIVDVITTKFKVSHNTDTEMIANVLDVSAMHPTFNAELIVSMLGVEQYCIQGRIKDFFKYVSGSLCKKGYLLLSFLDAEQIFKDEKGSALDNNKYTVEKLFEKKLTGVSQRIKIFDGIDKEEYAVSSKLLKSEASLVGLKCALETSLGDYLKKDSLEEEDREFIRFHKILVFVKK